MNIKVLILCLLVSSCSTLKKSLTYGGAIGGLTGAASGYLLSPDKESRGANAAVFGVVGVGISALLSYWIYKDDPRNQKLKHMLMPKKNPSEVELDLGGVKIDAILDRKGKYKTPAKDLPKKLVGKIKEQFIIKYESKEKYINKGDKTFYVPSFEIYEHAYESLGGEDE